jgi:hypothetical protein
MRCNPRFATLRAAYSAQQHNMQTGASQPLSLKPTGTLSRRHTAHFVSANDNPAGASRTEADPHSQGRPPAMRCATPPGSAHRLRALSHTQTTGVNIGRVTGVAVQSELNLLGSAPLLAFLPWDHHRLDGRHVSGALAESRLRLLKRKPMCDDSPKIDLSRGGESNRTRVDPRIAIHPVN